MLGIVPNTATIESGEIVFEGEDLLGSSDREMTSACAAAASASSRRTPIWR